MTVGRLLSDRAARDGARPLLTWYGADGSRVELSGATAANWAAKIANLLVDDAGLEPGDEVSVRLPSTWQLAVVLLGAWAAGVGVTTGPGAAAIVDATAGDAPQGSRAAHYAVGFDPLGLGLSRLVAAQPDVFAGVVPADPAAPALALDARRWTHAELAAQARAAAQESGLGADDRVASALPLLDERGVLAGLLAPLAAGAGVVLVHDLAANRLPDTCRAEKVTRTAGVDVPGVPGVG